MMRTTFLFLTSLGLGAVTATSAKTVVKPVARGSVPHRVHVFEDYETDVEKRWWLRGETFSEGAPASASASLPNRRACRSGETKDFDRKMGDPSKTYRAVVFNPVPGPPMAGNTRLAFRCRLKGTSDLRCQIYSLSKGYHRHLWLKGLPQNEWLDLTVNVTEARRPDGSGGPLAEDERIDDLQFYVRDGAEVSVDDVVLYEPARKGESEPFPRRIIFTGWFDTGKQGEGHEWPGDFDIVLHEKPRTWDAARAVTEKATGAPWIRVNLRGSRPLSEKNRLRFRYKTSAEEIRVNLRNVAEEVRPVRKVKVEEPGVWREASVDFSARVGDRVTDLVFRVPKGADLQVDDLLLYEPAE